MKCKRTNTEEEIKHALSYPKMSWILLTKFLVSRIKANNFTRRAFFKEGLAFVVCTLLVSTLVGNRTVKFTKSIGIVQLIVVLRDADVIDTYPLGLDLVHVLVFKAAV